MNKTGSSDTAPTPCARVPLSANTKRKLWAESAGFCGNPSCRTRLFEDEAETDFAEMAHIVPATAGGPRDPDSTVAPTGTERAHHSNVIVLCANCHTVVDKAPERYPEELMTSWKATRQDILEQSLGTPRFEERAAARDFTLARLEANRTIFTRYGPADGSFSEERAALWRRHVRNRIIPNNAELRHMFKTNTHLMSDAERAQASAFELHSIELEYRHLLDDHTAGTTRYPQGLDQIFSDQS